MRLCKGTYKDAAGVTQSTPNWYADFTDHMDRRQRLPLLTDKRQSEVIARKIEQLVRYRISGDAPDPTLAQWIRNPAAQAAKTAGQNRVVNGLETGQP